MKRTVSLVLALLMLMGVFTAVPVFAQDVVEVREVSVSGVVTPVNGAHPDYSAKLTLAEPEKYAFAKYGINFSGYNWMDDKGVVLDSNDTFVAGKSYQLEIKLEQIKDGNLVLSKFITPVSVLLDGKTPNGDVMGNEENIYIYNNYVCAAGDAVIDTVALTVTAPKAGEHPIEDAVCEPEYYIGGGVGWYNVTDGCFMNSDDVFEAGKDYTVSVFIKTYDGYKFRANGKDSLVKASINGHSASAYNIYSYSPETYIHIAYTFNADGSDYVNPQQTYTIIEKVDITGVAEPKVGEKALFSANTSDKGYSIDFVDWRYDESSMTQYSTFAAGKTYYAYVHILAKDGYRFKVDAQEKCDVNGTVNGESASVDQYVVDDNPKKKLVVIKSFTLSASAEPQHVHEWGDWTVTKKATLSEDGEETRECLGNPSHTETRPIAMVSEVNVPKWKVTYTGKAIKPAVEVKDSKGNKLTNGTDYKLAYPKNPTNVGEYVIDVQFIGKYEGLESTGYIIAVANNPMTVKANVKSVKAANAKKAKQTIKGTITVKKAQGTVSYKKVSKGSSKYLTISSKGVVTLKKGNYKKGTVLKLNVKVTAKGSKNYKSGSKTVTVKIKVK